MHHLQEFEQRRGEAVVPAWLLDQKVSTTLILRECLKELDGHPDVAFRAYILNGIRNGFPDRLQSGHVKQTTNIKHALCH